MRRLLPFLSIAVLGCAAKAVEIVPTIPIAPREFILEVAAQGEVRAKQALSVGSRARTPMFIAWVAEDGAEVKAGDLLVEFDASEAREQLTKANADFEKIEQEIVKHETQVSGRVSEFASEATRARIAHDNASARATIDEGILPRIEIDGARLDLRLAEIDLARIARNRETQTPRDGAALDLLKIRLEKAASARDQAKSTADEARLIAPAAGVVQRQTTWKDGGRGKVAPGDRVWGGSPVVSLLDLSALEFVMWAREADAVHLATGQKVVVRLHAFPLRELSAEVLQVAPVAAQDDFESSAKTIEVRLTLGAAAADLFPGLTGQAVVAVAKESSALLVPRDAVIREDDKTFVYVKIADREPERRAIVIGRESDDTMMVSEGLRPGDEVYARDPTKTSAELAEARKKRQEEAKKRRKTPANDGGMIMFF